MENKKLALVTFEQAERLKKAGFDWPTDRLYDTHNGILGSCVTAMDHNNDEARFCSAPTVALALKWMRDVKDIVTAIGDVHDIKVGDKLRYKACFCGYGLKNRIFCGMYNDEYEMTQDREYRTYESAESALLDELLTLIEK